MCVPATWDPALSASGTYQRPLLQQHACLRLSLLERSASSQQSAPGRRCAPQAALPAGKARIAAELAGKTPRVRLLAEARQRPDRAVTVSRSAGPAQSPKQGHGRNGKNRETQHSDCEGRGRRDGGKKAQLGKMHAAVAQQRRFGWVAFRAHEGAEREETWRRLSVTRPRAADLK